MRTTAWWVGAARVTTDVALALLLLIALTGTAVAHASTWGGWSWAPGLVVGAVMGALALLRRRGRFGLAVTALGLAGAAVVAARLVGLPAEPAPATSLGLAVLVASAVRWLPARRAAGVAGGGLAVAVASWLAAAPFTPATSTTSSPTTSPGWCSRPRPPGSWPAGHRRNLTSSRPGSPTSRRQGRRRSPRSGASSASCATPRTAPPSRPGRRVSRRWSPASTPTSTPGSRSACPTATPRGRPS
ncbi:MAG TPA: hypothetical protein VKY86_05330 [Promicromonospora sp.]|nr:hypothetical protein [Promicromonospora sp.]